MLTQAAIDHFGTRVAVARALGIQKSAVYKWGDHVPPLQAARLAQLTDGCLRFDPQEYSDWYSRKRQQKQATA